MSNLLLLALSLFLVVKSADFAIRFASRVAYALRLPKYVIGFLVVSVISILPETFIAISSSLQGIPSFGLGTLFGSNVADLTLVFAIIIFLTAREIKVGSKILENNTQYPFLLMLPILVGLDGYFSRSEGLLLLVAGLLFYYLTFKGNYYNPELPPINSGPHYRNFLYLLFSMAALLAGSHFTAVYGVAFAESIRINPILIGMLIVGLGTTLPELFFSLKAIRQKEDDLALGDILGTVIADATIAVGIIALMDPFHFPQRIIYVTAAFMVVSSLVLFAFMRSGKILTKKEALLLALFYVAFVVTEYAVSS